MKFQKKLKRIFQILLGALAITLVVILYISYITNHNQQQLDSISENIQKNYPLSEKIIYANQYGNYYIFTTQNQAIVLTKDYAEVLKEDCSNLKENPDHLALIYKTNQLMYEKTVLENNNLTYEYYDAKTGEKINTTTMERR